MPTPAIDGLTVGQHPLAGNDIAVEWGVAVEADIQYLYANGGGGGGGGSGMQHPVLIGTGDAVTYDFQLPFDAAEEIIWVDTAPQLRGTDYTRIHILGVPYIHFLATAVNPPDTGALVTASLSIAITPTIVPDDNLAQIMSILAM